MAELTRLPVMRPRPPTAPDVLRYLERIDGSGQYSNFGPMEQQLRQRVAEFVGVDAEQVATASNATLAIAGAVSVSDANHWIVPSFTFAATPAAVRMSGKSGEFRDIAGDWWLDPPDRLGAEVGLVPVAPFGSSIDMARWPSGRDVVIDAAASLGSRPALEELPPAWAVVFSMHATKVLGAGEGGLVVFGDATRAARFRRWSNFGFDSGRNSTEIGVNAKLSEIQAAYALAAFDGWPVERDEWLHARELVHATQLALQMDIADTHPGLDGVSPYWVVRFRSPESARVVEAALSEHGIGTRRWWGSGCHTMPAFADWAHPAVPRTEFAASISLGLPFYRGMTREDLREIDIALDAARRRMQA